MLCLFIFSALFVRCEKIIVILAFFHLSVSWICKSDSKHEAIDKIASKMAPH